MRSPRKTCSTTGYVSLFPFILSLIPPDSWILESQLDLISNRSILWTNFRLRSLSKTSSMYMKRNTEHDPPYWRGPIWTPLNYLIVSYLHHYTQAKTIYNELRSNLIRFIIEGNSTRMKISNDMGVKLYTEVKKHISDLIMYSLCILQQTKKYARLCFEANTRVIVCLEDREMNTVALCYEFNQV